MKSVKRLRALSLLLLLPLLSLTGCKPDETSEPPSPSPVVSEEVPSPSPSPPPPVHVIKSPDGATLAERFIPPAGYTRTDISVGSFAEFLRFLPLTEDGTPVRDADGRMVPDANAAAVLSQAVNSSRCKGTDVLLLMRALYLRAQTRTDEIMFHFESGFKYDYKTYLSGKRTKVNGSKVEWVNGEALNESADALFAYLDVLYSYSKASTLKRDTREAAEYTPGTLFTENGGVLVADTAYNEATGQMAILLLRGSAAGADSSCDLYILNGLGDEENGPWIIISEGGSFTVDGYSYQINNLREF